MFELPEFLTLARQMNGTLAGKTVSRGTLGNSPHKFVWYNRGHDEFSALTAGKVVGQARARGRWLFVPLDPGYVLLFGEVGGRLLYHAPGASLPAKYHLWLTFADGSALTALTQMWGEQDIMFRAGLHPKHPIGELDEQQLRALYGATVGTVQSAIDAGGRDDEVDLFGHPGGYRRLMDKRAAGQPCPTCGTVVEKLQYLGGACYVCPRCQI